MSIPDQNLPSWGGALGRIASAIKAVGYAHEKSYSANGNLQIAEGGRGEKIFSASRSGSGDGVSPSVSVTEISGGHRVTITDADHPQGQSFDVMDGQDGADGQDGHDGSDGHDGADGANPHISPDAEPIPILIDAQIELTANGIELHPHFAYLNLAVDNDGGFYLTATGDSVTGTTTIPVASCQ